MDLMDILSGVGNVLDTPGSVVRGIAGGDLGRAFGGIVDPSKRMSVGEIPWVKSLGLDSPVPEFLLNAIMDPLSWGAGGAAYKGANRLFRGIDAAGDLSKAKGLLAQSNMGLNSLAAREAAAAEQAAMQATGAARREAYDRFQGMKGFISPESLAKGSERTYASVAPAESAMLESIGGLGKPAPGGGFTFEGGLHPNMSRPDRLGAAGVPPPFMSTAKGRPPILKPDMLPPVGAGPTKDELDMLRNLAVHSQEGWALPGSNLVEGGAPFTSIHSPVNIFDEASRMAANKATPMGPFTSPAIEAMARERSMREAVRDSLMRQVSSAKGDLIPQWMQNLGLARMGVTGGWALGDALQGMGVGAPGE